MKSNSFIEALRRKTQKDKWEELKRKYAGKPKQPHGHKESDIQIACFNWFNAEYPDYYGLLHSIPNGGKRSIITAKIMKAEGQIAGASDLELKIASQGYHGLCIEMKTAKGKQSALQKEWQKKVESQGYKYIVCHSLDEFINEIKEYLKT